MNQQVKFHIIPKVYLKRFCHNEEGKLWIKKYESKVSESINWDSELFWKENYYFNAKELDSLFVEKAVLQKIEDSFNKLYNSIINHNYSNEIMDHLIDWIFSFQYRSSLVRQRLEEDVKINLNKEVSEEIINEISKEFAKDAHLNFVYNQNKYIESLNRASSIIKNMQFEFLLSKEAFISNEIGGFSIFNGNVVNLFLYDHSAAIYHVLAPDLVIKIHSTNENNSIRTLREASDIEIKNINQNIRSVHKLFVISKYKLILNELL